MVAATMAMMGLMGRLETIPSFLGRHTHDEGTGRPVAGFSEDSD